MQPLPRLRPLRSDLGIGALRPQLAGFCLSLVGPKFRRSRPSLSSHCQLRFSASLRLCVFTSTLLTFS